MATVKSNVIEDNAARKRKRESNQVAKMGGSGTTISLTPTSSSYQIVDIRQWLNGWPSDSTNNANGDDERKIILPIVDLRPYEEFNKRHLFTPKSKNGKHSDDGVPIVNLLYQHC